MYAVHLDDFEGPLDLLLFFIRRDELDIYDIPIARIADEYLAYVRLLERVDLDHVGDFIYMAALLISIKARMLLPSPELDEAGEPIDPRQELVERLLEYVRFKEAADLLADREEERAELFTRGRASGPLEAHAEQEPEVAKGSVFDLVTALRRVLTEAPEEPTHAIRKESYTIEEQQAFVLGVLGVGEQQSFVGLVSGRSKPFVITTFLAVLELARQGVLILRVPTRPIDFELQRPAAPAAVAV